MYAANHVLLRWHGHFGTIATEMLEFFSYGVRIAVGATPLTEEKKAAFLAAIESSASGLHSSAGLNVAGSAWLDRLTCAYIGLDGRYVGGDAQPTTERILASPVAGVGTKTNPFSHAMAITLRSDIDRGPGHQGRFYVPSGQNVDASGRWTSSFATGAGASARVVLDAINTAARVQWSPASAISVFSNKGAGTIGTVTSVGVGRAPDTQRRRDNRLLEEHVFADFTTTLAAREARSERVYT